MMSLGGQMGSDDRADVLVIGAGAAGVWMFAGAGVVALAA
jgi:hypothetical protein